LYVKYQHEGPDFSGMQFLLLLPPCHGLNITSNEFYSLATTGLKCILNESTDIQFGLGMHTAYPLS